MIIDTHTHFYDPSRPKGVPWPAEGNELLYRTVLPEHLKAQSEPQGVTGTVVVEASAWFDDNQWILDLAADDPYIVGFVGHLQPELDEFADHVERFSSNPLFRGIRLGRTHVQQAAQLDMASKLRQLVENDLELDLLVGPIDGYTPDPAWRARIEAVAKYRNVYCKVSGFVELAQDDPAPSDATYYAPTFDVLWNAFGEDRLIYGSNWPVCERACSYATVFQIAMDYVKEKDGAAVAKIFAENARAAYKFVER